MAHEDGLRFRALEQSKYFKHLGSKACYLIQMAREDVTRSKTQARIVWLHVDCQKSARIANNAEQSKQGKQVYDTPSRHATDSKEKRRECSHAGSLWTMSEDSPWWPINYDSLLRFKFTEWKQQKPIYVRPALRGSGLFRFVKDICISHFQ